LKPKSKP